MWLITLVLTLTPNPNPNPDPDTNPNQVIRINRVVTRDFEEHVGRLG